MLAANVICIAESQLGPGDDTKNYHIEGYYICHLDQANTVNAYHGLMVYVCDPQVVSHAVCYPGHNIEVIKRVLEHGMNQLCVIAIYSSPQTQATEF